MGRNLGVVFIVGQLRNICGIRNRRVMASGFQEAKMPQYFFDDFIILDKVSIGVVSIGVVS